MSRTLSTPRPRARLRPGRLAGFGAAALLGAYLLASAIIALVLTVPRRAPLEGNPQLTLGLPFEQVRLSARGEPIELAAWFIPAPAAFPPGRAIIMVHGKDGCRTCGYGGTALRLAGRLQERGFSVLMLELRGHGQSGDGRFTFGIRERRDVQGAVDWLLARGFAPGRIGLIGESMGAATSIGAAADEPAIGALVADSAYAELMPVLEQEFPRVTGLPAFLVPGAVLLGRAVVGEDIASSRPIDEIGRIAPRPVMLIHAAGDPVIAAEHSRRLAATAGVEAWVLPYEGHVATFARAPDEYVERVAAFFEAALR